MSGRDVETAIAIWADRHVPPALVAQQVRALQDSGVMDGILLCEQYTNFIPRQLWTPENTPLAAVLNDPDSHPDVFMMAGYLAAAAPELAIAVSTDSIRRGPVELVTSMLTLANITGGRANFQVGGGEVKQCKPFGYKRSQGMSRMEDLFRIFHLFWENQGTPFDYEGRRWTFEKATIGSAMPHRPTLWALGAGPTLLDHAATYCDGLAITCPPAWANAERFAEGRAELLELVESKGRDPEQFRFGVWFPVLMADSEAAVAQALDNPILKWLSALFGRIDNTLWRDEGMVSPLPEDWVYYQHLLPYDTPQSLIDDALAKVTPEHAHKGWLIGSPQAVADQVQPYIDAGADWVCPMDYMPLVLPPEEAAAAFARSIELCGLIKQAAAASSAAR